MTEQAKAVFLSYASQDAAAAEKICDALRVAGVEVWFDQSELVGGDSWDAKIRKQIKECALLIPIISTNTQSRAEGYFRLEWRLADQRTHLMGRGRTFLLPVCIDDTKDTDADVPDSFSAVQWTRARGGEVSPAFTARVKKLLDGSELEAGRPRPAERGEGAVSPVRNARSKWWWALPMFVVAMALLLVLKEGRKEPAPAASAAPLSEARQLTAKAMKLFHDGDDANRENFFLAEDVMKRAVALDNTDAEVWAAYGQLSVEVYRYGFDRSPARLEAMRTQVERAMKLDANSLAAQLAEAAAADYLGIDQAETEAKLRAMERRAPDSPQVLRALGQKLGRAGKIDDSLVMLNRAAALAPANPKPWADASAYLLAAGRFPEAEAIAAKSLACQANGRAFGWSMIMQLCWRGDTPGARAMLEQWPAWFFLEDRGASLAGLAALWSRDPAKALAIYQRMPRDYLRDSLFTGPRAVLTAFAHELAGHREAAQADWRLALQGAERELTGNPGDGHALYWKAWASARLGEPAVAEVIRQQLEQRNWAPASYFSPEGNMAGLALVSGNPDQAIAVLQRAVEPRAESAVNFKNFFVNYPLTRAVLELNPLFDPLRGDERFKQLLAKAPGPTAAPAPAASAPKIDDKSVAVLAFANLSDDKANEYFSDGISEELLNVLAKIPGLKVSARTSAFYFKGKEVPVPEIAKQLGVAYVVEGSVRKQGDKVRITAQLIKADGGFHVWSDTFTRDLKDIFAVQDEIAGLIAKNLSLKMGMTAARPTIDVEAYQEYLAGRALVARASNDDLRAAVGHFEKAVAIEPNFTAAWVQLASVHTQLGRWGGTPTLQAWAAARAAIDHAIALEPDSPDVLLASGWILRTGEWDWRGAERAYRRALELRPNHPDTLSAAAVLLYNLGRKDEALRLGRQAVQLDPLNAATQIDLSLVFYFSREWAEQEKLARRAIQLAPAGVSYHELLAFGLAEQRHFAEAEAEARVDPDDVGRFNALGVITALQGQGEAARGYRRQMEEIALVRGDTADLQLGVADISVILGDTDHAFAALEKAVAARDPSVAWFRNDFYLQPLQADPRWNALLRKVGLADDQLK